MRTLRLVGLSDDGSSLLLVADTEHGEEKFSIPVDDRLRAAARGDSRRLTQIDVDQGTELAPREIQARIRAGETPEQVAAGVIRAIERGRIEVSVAPLSLRAGTALASLFPGPVNAVQQRLGAQKIAAEMAKGQRGKDEPRQAS